MSDQIIPEEMTLNVPGGTTFIRDFVCTAVSPAGVDVPDWTGATVRATLKRSGTQSTMIADLNSTRSSSVNASGLLVIAAGIGYITVRLTLSASDTAAMGLNGKITTDLHVISATGVVQRIRRITFVSDGNYTTL